MTIAALCLSLYASAHVGDVLDTLDVEKDASGGDAVYVSATFGLVAVEDGVGDWICHEAVTAPNVFVAPSYVQGRSGRWAAWSTGVEDGRDGTPIWTSTDLCDWSPLTGLEGEVIAHVSIRDDVIWAATASSESTNGLFRAADGSFLPTSATSTDLFLSVDASGPAIWALSTNGDDLTLWHSLDGQTFVSRPVSVDENLSRPLRGSIGAVHPTDPDQAWLIIDPIGVDQLLHTSDAGLSTTIVWEPNDRLTDLARSPDGQLTAILNDRHPFTNTSGNFAPLDLPDAAGVGADAEALWFSHRTYVNDLFLGRIATNASQPELWGPSLIERPRSCPVGSDQASICSPLWPALSLRLSPPPIDTGLPAPPTLLPPADACGCSLLEPSFSWFLLVLSGLAWRRPRT